MADELINGPFGDSIPAVKNAPQALDPNYITSQLTRLYTQLGVVPTGPGTGPTDISYYAALVARTGGWFNDGTRQGDNAGYWVGRVISDFNRANGGSRGGPTGTGTGGDGTVPKGGAANGALVNRQLGLLEDDIVYRLALLAVNILQPLKDVYPNIVVVSGFRQVNTGIGQHELGEAVDLQIRNQSPQQLYEVATFISRNLNFDQLILNWTDIGDGQGWIHVSFSPKSLRYQVLTKDFADAFHEGLFFCDALTGEDAAAAQREQAAQDEQILAELTNIQKRQERSE